jgi:hypothetical protein
MLDLIEGAKIINGIVPTTATAAAGSVHADWINMENMHKVWTIINWSGGDSGPDIYFKTSKNYAGAGSSTAASAKWWIQTASTASPLDRMTRSTATSYVARAELGILSTAYTIVGMFDPASAPSSHPYLSVQFTSRAGKISATYICEPRYAGSQQFIATTSST